MIELDDRDLGPPAPPLHPLFSEPDRELLLRAEKERAEVGPGEIRPFVRELAERGGVRPCEWAVPMNSYERRELLPALSDGVFLEHLLHCASNINADRPSTYNWAVVHYLAPEARKRWQAYLNRRALYDSNSLYGKMAVREGWAGGRFEPTDTDRAGRDARSVYPVALLNPNAIHRVRYVAGDETLFSLELRGSIQLGALLPAEGDLVSVSGQRYRVGRKHWELVGDEVNVTVRVQAEVAT